ARLEAGGYSNIITLDNRDEAAIDGLAARYIRSAFADPRIFSGERNAMVHRPQHEAGLWEAALLLTRPSGILFCDSRQFARMACLKRNKTQRYCCKTGYVAAVIV